MSIFYGINSNYVGSLFSSLNSSTSGSNSLSGLSSLLGEYSNIQNGSYAKLARKYYGNTQSTDNTQTSKSDKTENKTNTSTSKDSTKTLSAIEDKTDKLKDAADALLETGTKSLFKRTTKIAEDGSISREYDAEKIYQGVKAFTDAYNNVVSSAGDSKVSTIQNDLKNLLNNTKNNQSMLSDMGISEKEDGTLEIDKEKFTSSDMGKVKSLFQGAGSYGYQVSARASMMNYHAQSESTKANTYTGSGNYSYNYSSGSLYDSLF